MCLHFLDLLQYEHFRKEIVNGQCARFIDDQQILHWQHYTRKRVRLLQNQVDKHVPSEANKNWWIPNLYSSLYFIIKYIPNQLEFLNLLQTLHYVLKSQ